MDNLHENPPLPLSRKYTSIFRIDGEPILPPLMTAEKRRQMQDLKERAVLVERRLREQKQQLHGKTNRRAENIKKEITTQQTVHNISQLSLDYNDGCLFQECEKSIDLLKNLIQSQQDEANAEQPQEVATTILANNKSEEKLQRLRKSEILIYDNFTNEVIKVPNNNESEKEDCQLLFRNRKDSQIRKSSHLLLAGTNIKGIQAIPTICLNPPTPLTVEKSICETVSGAESSESVLTSENLNQSLEYSYDLSSDESFNSMITHSDKKPTRNTRPKSTRLKDSAKSFTSLEKKSLTPERNVCAKIQQFEAISSDTNSPQSSPGKNYKNRKLCLETPSGTMNRSATSPSIKLNSSNRSSSSRSQSLAQDSDNSPENNLVRSSSFTLEGPSEALIEHMQQQKFINDAKSGSKSLSATTQNLSKNPKSNPLRAYRDTVESKAKKVQKMELKSSKPKPKTQTKTIQSKLASISPYSIKSQTQHSSYLCKAKKSPYHSSPKAMQRLVTTHMMKSNSTMPYSAQNKTETKLIRSSPTTGTGTGANNKTHKGNELLNPMAKNQKQKLMQLLADQEEEHQRLQYVFEMQHKVLIERLNREMANIDLKTSSFSHPSSTITSPSQTNKLAKDQKLSSWQLPNAHDSQEPSASVSDLTHHKTKRAQYQTQHSISNKSSNIAPDKNNTIYEKSHQNSLIPFNNSHLSLVDHLNANTSYDIPTLSLQTSPEAPLTQNIARKYTFVNEKSPSFRRRLFIGDLNGELADGGVLGSSSAASTPCAIKQKSMETRKQSQQAIYERNRRVPEENCLILHDAATKINAFARGFLVRRLFKTEQIKQIVQTIRDTLIFVLNLHIETMENPEESRNPANIKLKARLLQQLSAACRTLHWVFFQTSIKERMEMIARDRKRIKNKLMATNRTR